MTMDAPWLEGLEERVREAAEALRDLRQENADLTEKVRQLEEQLAASQEEGGDGAAWQEERNEIRQRVETLAETLETLLEEE